MKKHLLVFYLWAISHCAFAFSESELVTLLQKPNNVQGEFVQQRFLKSLTKPIQTSGQFTLLKQQGLLWQMQKPFVSDVRVNHKGIMQWNGIEWVENGRMGQSQQISLFLGLLSGETSALAQEFTLELSGEAHQWQLLLTPNSLLMKQIFEKITIFGDHTVKRIELYEKQGDHTAINLQKISLNSPLSSFAQRALE